MDIMMLNEAPGSAWIQLHLLEYCTKAELHCISVFSCKYWTLYCLTAFVTITNDLLYARWTKNMQVELKWLDRKSCGNVIIVSITVANNFKTHEWLIRFICGLKHKEMSYTAPLHIRAVQFFEWLCIKFKVNNFCGISVLSDWKLQVSDSCENGQQVPLCSHPEAETELQNPIYFTCFDTLSVLQLRSHTHTTPLFIMPEKDLERQNM